MRVLTTVATSLALTRDSRWLLTGDAAGGLQLWDLEAARRVRTLKEHDAAVTSISRRPMIAGPCSGGGYESLRLWDVRTGQVHRTVENRLKGLRQRP